MKVDEHKYYDGFLGAMNAAAFLERDSEALLLNEKWRQREEPLFLSFYGSQQVISQRSEWLMGKRFSVLWQISFCWLTGIRLHISKSDDDPSEHFGSSFKNAGKGGGGIEKSGGGANPQSVSQSNLKSMSNFFHITIDFYLFSRILSTASSLLKTLERHGETVTINSQNLFHYLSACWMNFDSFYCKLELCKISAFFLF